MESSKVCYIRRRGYPWTIPEPCYRRGLELYFEQQKNTLMPSSGPIMICSQNLDGSIFMANYRKKNALVYTFQIHHPFSDEVEEEMDIMLCSSSRA